ncbi:MAG: hypothetical protein Q8R92_07850 [Deltaproteobacteria bacterium]|nr:hypothetical protein [Deltaproteobacteria bacterium]
MKASVKGQSLLFWNPFLLWETAPAALEPDREGGACSQTLESALPAAVEAAGEEDAEMAPSGFTHWF